eukprot:GILJ01013770.1.p1 GENE.GILJ01013770.1~~GILJ01013770.1.p1  ORF type:complete len:291 (+),score=36.21 GILJ01013770.1:112-984(+)
MGDKESFGDIDVVMIPAPIAKEENDKVVLDRVRGLLVSHEVSVGRCLSSFEWEGFQVDINLVETPQHLRWLCDMWSFSGLVVLIGIIATRLNLKLARDGLYLRTPHVFLLTRDFPAVVAAMGFDVRRWTEGLSSVSDFCDFVKTSVYYQPKMFRSLQHTVTRDQRRDTLVKFLDSVVDDLNIPLEHRDHPDWVECFGRREQYQAVVDHHRIEEAKKVKVTGKTIHQWTGLQGAMLSSFLQLLRSIKPDFDQWITAKSVDEVQKFTMDTFHSEWPTHYSNATPSSYCSERG